MRRLHGAPPEHVLSRVRAYVSDNKTCFEAAMAIIDGADLEGKPCRVVSGQGRTFLLASPRQDAKMPTCTSRVAG